VLSRKLRLYFRHFYSEKMAIDEQEILRDLSTTLRMEVSTFLVSELMGQVSLFRLLNPVHWAMILPLLRPCRFTMNDFVCHQGDDCTDMFVVLSGTCKSQTLPLAEKPDPPTSLTEVSSSSSSSTTTSKSTKKSLKSKSSNKKTSQLPSTSQDESKDASDQSGNNNSNAAAAGSAGSGSGWVVKRVIGASDTINALCLVGVWTKSIESVQCEEVVEAYGINCDEVTFTHQL
jgi:hypothetical protein